MKTILMVAVVMMQVACGGAQGDSGFLSMGTEGNLLVQPGHAEVLYPEEGERALAAGTYALTMNIYGAASDEAAQALLQMQASADHGKTWATVLEHTQAFTARAEVAHAAGEAKLAGGTMLRCRLSVEGGSFTMAGYDYASLQSYSVRQP